MPHQDHVNLPYFPAVVLFPFYAICQQFQQKFFYEKTNCCLTGKSISNLTSPWFFADPDPYRNRKSKFFPFCNFIWQLLSCHFPKKILCLPFSDFISEGQLSRKFENIIIKLWYTKLQRICHAHPVRFLKNIPRKPVIDINLLHTFHCFQIYRILVLVFQQFIC